MDKLIVHSLNSQDRFFPPIGPSLYGPVDTDQNARDSAVQGNLSHAESSPEAILELANRTFTRWQLWTGRGLDSEELLGRLLWLHRNALDEELNGRWRRADFYWREVIRALKQMNKRAGVWEHLNECFDLEGKKISNNSGGLRHRIIVELFIDTNFALLNGRLKQSKTLMPHNRAFIFADRIRELLSLTKMGDTERWLIAEPLADFQVEAHKERGQIGQALKICEDMAREFPAQWKYQDLIVELEAQSVLNQLHSGEDRTDNLSDARSLRKTVENLEKLSKTFPYNPGIYETLGLLNQVLAVKLANGGELSQALLAIEESLAYDPRLTQAAEIRDQLRESMNALKAQVTLVEAQIAASPGAVLSEEGRRLKREVRKGERSADRFIESGRAAALSEAAQKSRAVRFWRLAGLGAADDQIAASAMKLYEILPSLFDGSHENLETFRNRIVELTQSIPEFDASMQDSLLSYLEQQLSPGDAPEEEAPAQRVLDLPTLEPYEAEMVPSKEPAGMWLFSREGLAVKTLAVITLAAMLVSGAMAGWSGYERYLRDQAYSDLITAVHSGNEQRVLHAAVKFISVAETASDARRTHVQILQEQARMAIENPQARAIYGDLIEAVHVEDLDQIIMLSERFRTLAADNPDDPRFSHVNQLHDQARDITERAKRDEAYQRLTQAVSQQDLTAVISAADTFLALPQTNSKDPRTDQVRKIKEKAQELPNQWARDAAYKDLLAAINAENPSLEMNAAEAFLSAPPVQVVDARHEQVMDAYSRAFISWFIGLSDPAAPLARQRVRTYRDLVADKRKEW